MIKNRKVCVGNLGFLTCMYNKHIFPHLGRYV